MTEVSKSVLIQCYCMFHRTLKDIKTYLLASDGTMKILTFFKPPLDVAISEDSNMALSTLAVKDSYASSVSANE